MPLSSPILSDFPKSLVLTVSPPPTSAQRATNVLLLLHGLGDTHTPLTSLASQLNLPETVCISLRASTPLPFDLGGFHWGDDIAFNSSTGGMDYDTGFTKSTRIICEVIIEDVLVKKCGYTHREVLILGMSQGGSAALAAAAFVHQSSGQELGGVISLGGPLPEACALTSRAKKVGSPVLLCGGNRGTMVTKSKVEDVKRIFADVEYAKWEREGDGMAKSRQEMMPIMRFFGRRLKSRAGVPEGGVEVG